MPNLLESVFCEEVLTDSPTHWWRLGEAQGVGTAYDRVVGGNDFAVIDGPTQGQTGLVAKDANTATYFAHTVSNRLELNPGNIVTSLPLTIEAVIQVNASDTEYRVIFTSDYDASAVRTFTFRIGDSGAPGGAGFVGGGFGDANLGNQVGAVSSVRVDDGKIHHVVLTIADNVTPKVYVDGVDRTVVEAINSSFTVPTTRFRDGIGNVPAEQPVTGEFGLDGSLQDVVVYNRVLSAARIAAHSAAVFAPWNGDTPGQRVGRVLDAAGFPAVDRTISTGSSVLQTAPDTTGQRVMDHLQAVADSEAGKVFVGVHGELVFKGRTDGINQSVQATFTDQHGANPAINVATPEYSDQLLKNDVTIQRDGGVRQNVQDATSIGVYLDHSYDKTGLYHNSDDTSRSLALYIVGQYKSPTQRVTSLTLKPRESATLMQQALSLALTDWITIMYTPQGVGPAFSQTTVIEGIQHTFGPKEWTTTFSLSPADTNAYWQLGVSGLGQTTRLFF